MTFDLFYQCSCLRFHIKDIAARSRRCLICISNYIVFALSFCWWLCCLICWREGIVDRFAHCTSDFPVQFPLLKVACFWPSYFQYTGSFWWIPSHHLSKFECLWILQCLLEMWTFHTHFGRPDGWSVLLLRFWFARVHHFIYSFSFHPSSELRSSGLIIWEKGTTLNTFLEWKLWGLFACMSVCLMPKGKREHKDEATVN